MTAPRSVTVTEAKDTGSQYKIRSKNYNVAEINKILFEEASFLRPSLTQGFYEGLAIETFYEKPRLAERKSFHNTPASPEILKKHFNKCLEKDSKLTKYTFTITTISDNEDNEYLAAYAVSEGEKIICEKIGKIINEKYYGIVLKNINQCQAEKVAPCADNPVRVDAYQAFNLLISADALNIPTDNLRSYFGEQGKEIVENFKKLKSNTNHPKTAQLFHEVLKFERIFYDRNPPSYKVKTILEDLVKKISFFDKHSISPASKFFLMSLAVLVFTALGFAIGSICFGFAIAPGVAIGNTIGTQLGVTACTFLGGTGGAIISHGIFSNHNKTINSFRDPGRNLTTSALDHLEKEKFLTR